MRHQPIRSTTTEADDLVPIDPRILNEAGRIAYDEALSIEEREDRLERLAGEEPALVGSIRGYLEMLSMHRMAWETTLRVPEALGTVPAEEPPHQVPEFCVGRTRVAAGRAAVGRDSRLRSCA